MNRTKFSVSIILFFLFNHTASSQSFDITTYGAVADGKTVNTTAVQKAVDACNHQGGGRVIIPAGVFIIGTIYLKSNVHLYLEGGAVLRGSPNLKDYTSYNAVHYGMLYAENVENITISGFGNIDGNGDLFFDLTKPKSLASSATKYTRQKEYFRKVLDGGVGDGPVVPKDRPYQMFIFSNCKRVTIKDIFVTQAPMWTMHFADCDGVRVDGIRLWTNMLAPNADGIDITSCNNVIIANCENVKFDNITCRSENGILVYGTEESRIENVTFHDVTLELVDSKLNDVAGGNIDLRGCSGEKNQLFQRDLPGLYGQYVTGLSIENFRLEWTGTRMPFFTHGIEVNNFSDLQIRNFKGTASPINKNALPIFIEKGEKADVDAKTGVMKIEVKE